MKLLYRRHTDRPILQRVIRHEYFYPLLVFIVMLLSYAVANVTGNIEANNLTTYKLLATG